MQKRMATCLGGVVVGVAIAAWCGDWSSVAAAQTRSSTPEFTFATVTARAPDDKRPGGVSVLPGGRFEVRGLPLRALIYMAYNSSTIVAPSQVVGGPSWIDTAFFDITATGEGTLTGPDGFTPHLMAMVRSLVNERFQLKIHTEKKEIPVYELVLADSAGKLGPGLVASHSNCGIPNECGAFTRSFTMDVPVVDMRTVVVAARGVTMGDVALHFAVYPFVARPIFDRTGLAGRYDIVNLNYVGALRNPQPDSSQRLFTSLAEQLWLQLRGARQAAEVIVVDAAERPTQHSTQ
jgi:uncharacterized protein (TIGR03435 family)